MQKCKRSARLLVLVLAFAMVLGMVPWAPVYAETAAASVGFGDFTFTDPRDVPDGRIEIINAAGLSGNLYFVIADNVSGLPTTGPIVDVPGAASFALNDAIGTNVRDWQWLRVFSVNDGVIADYRDTQIPGNVIGTLLYGPTSFGPVSRGFSYAIGNVSWDNLVIEADVMINDAAPAGNPELQFYFRHGGNPAQNIEWGQWYRLVVGPTGGVAFIAPGAWGGLPPGGWQGVGNAIRERLMPLRIEAEANRFLLYADGTRRLEGIDENNIRSTGWVGIHARDMDVTINNFRVNRIRPVVGPPDDLPTDDPYPYRPVPTDVILNSDFSEGMNHWTPQNDSNDPVRVLSSEELTWWDVGTHGPHTYLLRVGPNAEGAWQNLPQLRNSTTHYLRIQGAAFGIAPGDNLGVGIQRSTPGTWHTVPLNANFGWRHSWLTTVPDFGVWDAVPQAYVWKNPGSSIAVYISEFSLIEAAVVGQAPYQTKVTIGERLDTTGLVVWVYDNNRNEFVRANNAGLNIGGYSPWTVGEQRVVVTYSRFGRVYSTYFTVTFVLPDGDIPINNPVVSGVRRPMLGRTPVNTVTATPQFTGTVEWDTVDDVFGERSYTATITLTPNPGFTLEGVPANFFTVDYAASVTHSANSGVITVVFPALSVGEMRDMDAMDFVRGMRVGWNLGNTLDAHTNTGNAETIWMPHLTTRPMIEAIADAGFDILRIPVTWTTGGGAFRRVGPGPDYIIAPWFLDRVEEVVNWGLDAGMNVIINAHHDNWKYGMRDDQFEANRNMVEILWTQIAEHFINYCDRLIFATMNEPMQGYPHGGGGNWIGAPEYYRNVNRYNQLILNAIRATGGNNQRRFVMVPTYAAGAHPNHLSYFVLPTDMYENRLIASVHSYAPVSFTFGGINDPNNVFTQAGRNDVNWFFNRMNHYFVSRGIPVIVGEFGSQNKNNTDQRADHAAYFVAAGRRLGIPCVWWDNYTTQGTGERFGIFNRGNNTFFFPEIVDAMMEVVWNDPDPVTLSVTPVFNEAAGRIRIQATVRNVDPAGQAISGRVELVSPVNFFTVPYAAFSSLAYGQEIALYFDLNPYFVSPIAQETLVFNVTANDFVGTVYLPFVYTVAGFTPVPIKIDGVLDEDAWRNAAKIIDFSRGVIDDYGTLASTLDPDDLSATGMVAWDKEYLYIAITVTDSVHFQNQVGSNIWQGDGIQISVRDNVGFREMGFALHNDGTITQWCWLNSTSSPVGTGAISQDNARSVIIRDDVNNQTVYEIAIRWDYLGFADVSVGDIARISFTINDSDGGVRRFIEYGAGIAVGVKGDNMGYLLLVPGNEPAPSYHTVTFTVEPGAVGVYAAVTTSIEVPHGKEIPAAYIPNPVARRGFYFAGWHPNSPAEHGNVYEDLAFTARFNPLFHYVTFVAGHGGVEIPLTPWHNPVRVRDGWVVLANSVPYPKALPGFRFVKWAVEGVEGAVNPLNFTVLENVTFTAIFETEAPMPVLSFDIFNNGPGGAPSRPNASLAASGIIRMWTQLDGVGSPIYFAAADTVTATDQDGNCAMDFVRINRMWAAGIGWLDYFNLIDVSKNADWQTIKLSIVVYGQVAEVLLVNANAVN
ncbi:MAG: cellulase family glycosylhydrolase [Firmicutes bacterium]|nr:cellulase family glycosylhydrolase [Bacillota bacterium]